MPFEFQRCCLGFRKSPALSRRVFLLVALDLEVLRPPSLLRPTASLGSQHSPQVWSATRTTPGTPEAAVRAAGLSYCGRMRIRIRRGKTLAARGQESSKCPAVRLHPAPASGHTCCFRSGARERAHSMADPTALWAMASRVFTEAPSRTGLVTACVVYLSLQSFPRWSWSHVAAAPTTSHIISVACVEQPRAPRSTKTLSRQTVPRVSRPLPRSKGKGRQLSR